jgi:cytochrome c553
MRSLLSITTLALLLAPPIASAHGDPTLGRNLAATCANCHGTNGQSQGGMPALAGMPEAKLIGLMKEFKEGKKPATIMHQLSKGYTDEQISHIAEYFAAQRP